MKQKMRSVMFGALNLVETVLPSSGPVILLYHDVGESDLYLTVRAEQFKRQMRFLKERGYNVVPLMEMVQKHKKGASFQPKTVALTFDDGYVSHLEMVVPLLEHYAFHGTFFISVNAMGAELNNSENRPQPVLTPKQVQELDTFSCASVEPHSLSHKELSNLSQGEVRVEVQESKNVLEALLKKRCTLFAYPRGVYSRAVVRAVVEAGYEGAVTVESRAVKKKDDPFILPRYTIHSQTGVAEFKAKLARAGGWITK